VVRFVGLVVVRFVVILRFVGPAVVRFVGLAVVRFVVILRFVGLVVVRFVVILTLMNSGPILLLQCRVVRIFTCTVVG